MSIGDIIKKRRQELHLTLEDLGNLCGVGKSTVRKWENGMIENMGRDKISALAKSLKISPLTLLNMDEDEEMYKSADIDYIRIPLYLPICCGNGAFVDDDIIEYVPVPSKGLSAPENYFCQIARGDSMKNAGIDDGDLLVFEKSSSISSGSIGCFCIDENEAVCKKYSVQDNMIILLPMNSEYNPMIIDPMNECFKCLGILKRSIKNFNEE